MIGRADARQILNPIAGRRGISGNGTGAAQGDRSQRTEGAASWSSMVSCRGQTVSGGRLKIGERAEGGQNGTGALDPGRGYSL
jgi:hypothetical protein